MDAVVHWFFFSVRSIVVAVITFYGFKFTPYFFPRSDHYFQSAFDVLKKRLYMTGIVFVVAANILFYPELWKDRKPDPHFYAPAEPMQTIQPIPEPNKTVELPKPVIPPAEVVTEQVKAQPTPEPDNVEALADHQLYDVENKTDKSEQPEKSIAEKPLSAIPGY